MRSIPRSLPLFTLAAAIATLPAHARPPGPAVLCEVFPEAAACAEALPACATCHTAPPARNALGAQIEAALLPGVARPLDDAQFADALRALLPGLGGDDPDLDGVDTLAELVAGTNPGDAGSAPSSGVACAGASTNPAWDVCGYDPRYAFRRVQLDVCGRSPTWAALKAFEALDPSAQRAAVHDALDTCLDSAFWVGPDGVLWRMAHAKIRPLAAVKSGPNSGPVPLANYDDDYALFVWTHSDDRDVREVLTAQYYVRRVGPTRYEQVDGAPDVIEFTQPRARAGMLTTGWFAVINTMFTPVPRTTAAQAYRAYLGLDIAKSEGLVEPDAPLVDYDDKGITADGCAGCHRTLDPLAYPFSRYWGIAGGNTGVYDPRRPTRFDAAEGSRLAELPEAGALFGEPVANLVEWAARAANSPAFARATVADYWRHFLGHDPTPAERAEFEALVAALPTEHAYRVERMLHALIDTEAYGAP
jgi:hypothetical protein